MNIDNQGSKSGSSSSDSGDSRMDSFEPVDDSKADRIAIKRLHDSICGHAKISLEEAAQIGEILTKRKLKCGHGKFESWLEANVEFTPQTARNYMRIFNNREWLKTKTVFDLSDAYVQIAAKEDLRVSRSNGLSTTSTMH